MDKSKVSDVATFREECEQCGKVVLCMDEMTDYGQHGWHTWICMDCVGEGDPGRDDRHPGDFEEEDFT